MKKVSKEVWNERMNNLNVRRSKEVIKNSVPGVDMYGEHIRKGYIGKTVLDVGCGSMIIKKHLPEGTKYAGIDPFPLNDQVRKMEIENCVYIGNAFETVYCFAALDNVYDFDKAVFHMKRVAEVNVMFLTGVEIEPDQYHTIKITEAMLVEAFAPEFEVSYKEYLHPKILLIEFTKKSL